MSMSQLLSELDLSRSSQQLCWCNWGRGQQLLLVDWCSVQGSSDWGRLCQQAAGCSDNSRSWSVSGRSSDQSASRSRFQEEGLIDDWAGRNFSLVVQSTGRVLGLDSGLVRSDGCTETGSIGDVVHSPESAVSITQTIRSSDSAVW
jgi:hypothetical protein